MKKTLGKEIENKEERIAFLTDNSDSVLNKGYMRRFTQEELDHKKTELSEIAIDINEIELRKKEAAVMFKAELKPRQEEMATVLQQIKQKAEFVTENCFKFVDRESKTVGFYSQDGDLIEQRPAYGDEMQTNLFAMSRTGTE